MGKPAKQEKSDSVPNEQHSIKEIEDQKAALKKAAARKVNN